MKTIYIPNGATLPARKRIYEFLRSLPPSKRGNRSYRVAKFAVTFVRRDDATAFRLKFGL